MAKWRHIKRKIKKVREYTLEELKGLVELEDGDMLEVISGEFPYKSIRDKSNWTLLGNHNRFSVITAKYTKHDWGYANHSILMPIDASDIDDLGMIQISNDPYMRGTVRIFPVDSVDNW